MRLYQIPSLLVLAALASPAMAQLDASFQVDSGATQFTWSGTTSVGDIDEQPANFTLVGTTGMTIDGGGNPVGAGSFPGTGDAQITPDISGVVPNPVPILPPLAMVQLQNAHLQISSAGFTVDNGSGFSTQVVLTVLQGTLTVDDILGNHSVNDLAGTQSAPTQAGGTLSWNGTQYVLAMPISSVFLFADPASGITGSLTLNGNLVALHQPSAPAVYCNSLPNSSGGTGTLSFGGATSLGAGSPTLQGSQLPSNTFGLFFYGTQQSSTPFGNGVLCAAGGLQRLVPVNTGAGGVVNQLIDNSGLPASGQVQVGERRNFQFWFRDVPAAGAMFNTSDAISILYTP